MKSEKAREFIDGCINNLTVDMADHAERQLRLAMTHTAELAEQEAEERMRERAIEAYCDWCFVGITRECQVSKACCNDLQYFIQILDEKKRNR